MKQHLLLLATVLFVLLASPGLARGQSVYRLNESFDGVTQGAPAGWDVSEGTASYQWTSDNQGYNGTRCMRFDSYFNTPSTYNLLKTPALDLSQGDWLLTFRYRITDCESFAVYISTDGGATYATPVAATLPIVGNWTYVSYNITALAQGSSNVKIVFRGSSSYSYVSQAAIYIDDVTVESVPTCKSPSALSVISATQTTATLMWGLTDDGDVPASYTLNVTDQAGNAVVTNQSITAPNNTYTITGLTTNTTYNVTLAGDCSSSFHGLSNATAITFTTLCDPQGAPYVESYDLSNDFPACNLGYNATITSDSRYGAAGHAVALATTASESAYIIFPELTHSANDIEASFFMRTGSVSGGATTFMVGVATDAYDPAAMEVLYTGSLEDTQWHEIRMNTSAYFDTTQQTVRLAVFIPAAYQRTTYLDQVSLHAIPTCTRPEQLSVSGITATSVNLSWTTTNAAEAEITIVAGTDTTYQRATTNPYTVTGLTPNTDYSFYIRGICSATDQSEFNPNAATAHTLCLMATAAALDENFDNLMPNTAPECWSMAWWTKPVSNQLETPFSSSTYYAHSGSRSMMFARQQAGSVARLTSQQLPVDSAYKYQVSLWMFRDALPGYANEGLKIWASPVADDTVGATLLGYIHRNHRLTPYEATTGWKEYNYVIPRSGNLYIIVEGIAENGGACYFDDFRVMPADRCPDPRDIAFSNVTGSTVDLSWTANGTESQWQINYSVISSLGDTIADTVATVNTPAYTITGLEPSSRFTVTGTVAAVCRPGETSTGRRFTAPVTTACMPISRMPYFESFESGDFPPACWQQGNLRLGGGNLWNAMGSMDAADGMYNAIVGDAQADNLPFISTPEFNFQTGRSYQVRFAMYRGDMYEQYQNEGLHIYVGPNAGDTVGAVHLGYVAQNYKNQPAEMQAGIYGYTFDIPASVSGTNHILFVYASQMGHGTEIDAVTVRETPACEELEFDIPAPTTNAITINLRDNTVQQWEASYGLQGTTADQGTIVAFNGTSTGVISNLQPETTYSVYVRRVCGTDHSAWSFVRNATALCAATTVPFTDDFEQTSTSGYLAGCYTQIGGRYLLKAFTDMPDPQYPDESFNHTANGSRGLTTAPNPYSYYPYDINNASDVLRLVHFEAGRNYEVAVWAKAYVTQTTNKQYRLSFVLGSSQNSLSQLTSFTVDHADFRQKHTYFTVPETGDYLIGFRFEPLNNTPYMPFIDDYTIAEAGCVPPAGSTITGLSDNAATINVTGVTGAWDLVVSSSPIDINTTVVGDVLNDSNITARSVSLTGLTLNTTYYYTARSRCAGTPSAWMEPGSFRTRCAVAELPYITGFDSATPISCWATVGTTGSIAFNGSTSYAGAGSMEINGASAVSPELNTTSLASSMVSGRVLSTQGYTSVGVGVMLDPEDPTTYESLGSITINEAGRWQEFTFYFDELLDDDYADFRSARYVVLSAGAGTVLVDDLAIELAPSCRRPSGGMIMPGLDAAIIDWDDRNSASQWVVRATSANSATIEQTVTSHPYTLAGLRPAETYTIYVAAICSATDSSAFAELGTVTTGCDVITGDYEENFNSMLAGTVPACWNNSGSTSATLLSHPEYFFGVHTANRETMLRMANFGINNGTAEIITPQIALSAGGASGLSFDYTHQATCGNMTVGVRRAGETTFTELGSYGMVMPSYDRNTPAEWTGVQLSLAAYQGDTVEIRFSATGDYYEGAIFLDNIKVRRTLTCSDVTGLALAGITAHSATAVLSDTSAAHTQWQYAVVPRGFAATGTLSVTTTDTIRVTGLAAETAYDLCVRAYCGAGDTSHWSRLSFTTSGEAAALPYVCSFDDAQENALWQNTHQGTNLFAFGHDAAATMNSTAGMYVSHDGQSYGYDPQAVSLSAAYRTLEFGSELYDVELDWQCPGGYEQEDFGRFYLAPAFVDPQPVFTNTGYYFYYYYTWPAGLIPLDGGQFVNKVTGRQHAAVTVDMTGRAGAYNLVFVWANGHNGPADITGQPFAVSQVSVRRHSCAPVENIALTDATTTSVRLTFDNPDHDLVRYVLSSSAIEADSVAQGVTTSDTVVIAGLTASTKYNAMLRRECASGDVSLWTSLPVQTECAPATLPIREDFEQTTYPAICWTTASSADGDYYGDITPGNWVRYTTSYATNMIHGSGAAYMYQGPGAGALLISPEFEADSTREYFAGFYRYNQSSSSYAGSEYRIYVNRTPELAGARLIGSWPAYTASAASGATLSTADLPRGTHGSCYVIIEGAIDEAQSASLYIDDILIDAYPDCRVPAAPQVVASTATTITASVELHRQSAIEFGLAPYTANATAADITQTVVSTTGRATFTGLQAGGLYAIYARGICTDTTEWSAATAGTTEFSDCFTPQSVRPVYLAADSAIIAWNAVPDAASFLYTLTGGTATISGTATTDTVTLTSLTPNTEYSISVAAICQAGDTTYPASATFLTTGRAAELPYVTGFEDAQDNMLWSFTTTACQNRLIIGSDASGANSGNSGLFLSADGTTYSEVVPTNASGSTAYNAMAARRTVRFAHAGRYEVSFDWRSDAAAAGSSYFKAFGRSFLAPAGTRLATDQTAFDDGTATSALPDGAIRLIQKMNNQPQWTRYTGIVDIDEPCTMDFIVMWSAQNKYGYASATDLGQTPLAVDNVSIDELRCQPVESIALLAATDSALTFAVTKPDGADIEYALTTSAAESSITTISQLASTALTDTLTFAGLTPQTDYYLFVRRMCADGTASSWRSLRASTIAVPAALPYNCTFEDVAERRAWRMVSDQQTNYFVTGTATDNGGLNALYVTNDGQTYAYTNTAASLAYATRLFRLEPGTYEYSYDWKGFGEAPSYDFGRAFVCPASTALTAGGNSTKLATLPTDAIALDGDQAMTGQATWTTATGYFNITEAGLYNLVFGWANNHTAGNTPLAVDNVELTRLACPQVGAAFDGITATDALVAIDNIAENAQVEIGLSHTSNVNDIFRRDTVPYFGPMNMMQLTGLSAAQTYTVFFRALCDSDNVSPWSSYSLTTACGTVTDFPFHEDFESMAGTEMTWGTRASNADQITSRCWLTGGSVNGTFTQVVNDREVISGTRSLVMNNTMSGGFDEWSVVALPRMNNIASLEMEFRFFVGTMMESLSFGYLTSASVTSFVELVDLTNIADGLYQPDLSAVPQTAQRLAFKYTGMSGATIDDIMITHNVPGPQYADTICYSTTAGYTGHGFTVAATELQAGQNTITRVANDTLYTLNLYMRPEAVSIEFDTICSGLPYDRGLWGTLGGIENPTTSRYTHTFRGASVHGCDSTVVLNLVVAQPYVNRHDTICEGASLTWGDTVLTTAGQYTRTFSSAWGCDVTETLYLVVEPDTVTTQVTICQDQTPYFWNGMGITQSGTYAAPAVGSHGCAQTAVLVLTVSPTDSTIVTSFCHGGQVQVIDTFISTAGQYTLRRVSAAGCDIVYHVTATEDAILTGSVSDWVCEGSLYTGNGIAGLAVTADTVVTVTTKTDAMCDSVTNVSIRFVPTVYVVLNETIPQGSTYEFDDQTLNRNGSYTATFRTDLGCDSVVTLNLVVSTGVDDITTTGRMTIVPNPQRQGAETLVVTEQTGRIVLVELINSFGAIVESREPNATPITITAPRAAGIYHVRLTTADGRVFVGKLVVE